jgi:long-subunit fatty acid transport protein
MNPLRFESRGPVLRFWLCWMALAVTIPPSVFGLGIQITDQDPFATARGSAFVATADNPSGVFYNPAGITQLSGHEFRMGIYGVTYQARHETAGGASVESDRAYESVPQLYWTFTPANTVRGSAPSPAGESADGRYTFSGHALTMTTGLRL